MTAALTCFGIAAASSGLPPTVISVPSRQRIWTVGLGTPAASAALKARTMSRCLNWWTWFARADNLTLVGF